MSVPRSFLFVIDHLSSGGAQQQMVMLAREFRDRGHAVRFLVYRRHSFHDEVLAQAEIPVEQVPGGWFRPIRIVRRIRSWIRSGRIDAILAYLAGPGVYSILARRSTHPGVPVVVSERSGPGNPDRSLVRRAFARLRHQAERVVVNSHHMREHLCTVEPALARKVVTIWNGVDLSRFRPSAIPSDAEGTRFMAIGQIGAFKQPECVMRALAILRDSYGIRASVTWFARRFPELTVLESAEMRRLDQILSELGLGELWQWRPETREIDREIPRFHALIHASILEGLPNVMGEAMASGRPVIASRTLDHPRLICEGETGMLFEPRDPADLARVLRDFCLLSRNKRQEMGTAAARFASENLAPGRCATQYLDLFESLIPGGEHGPGQ